VIAEEGDTPHWVYADWVWILADPFEWYLQYYEGSPPWSSLEVLAGDARHRDSSNFTPDVDVAFRICGRDVAHQQITEYTISNVVHTSLD
jgi:hypothetical protein